MRRSQRLGLAALAPLALMLSLLMIPSANYGHEAKQNIVERRQVNLAIADFILIDQSGQKFHFKNLRGKVVIVAFAYTTCPDVCPLITAALRQVQTHLSQRDRENTYFLTVTTDPEIDSPKVLAAYAKRYGAELGGWSFLTGDESTLKSVWKSFGVGVKRKARGLVDHTPLTAIVDRNGVMRVAYVGPSPDLQSVLRDIRWLMTENR